ncbi:hypothetical protein HPP92_023227 [Vanilla planifolia]|uniref:DUF506 family protein n=1 Tax=Vanilla planifolia TaxID=51239 RepID=A0A835PSY9_VANPL|nr:hypothetical protein HPP92_023227 [Vanilla planifolia]
MAVYIRAKRVTDPLDERVLARLRGEMTGYASSGSDHEGEGVVDCSFSSLVHAFLEVGNDGEEDFRGGGDGDGEGSDSDDPPGPGVGLKRADEQGKKVRDLLFPRGETDPLRIQIRSEVEAAATRAMGTRGSVLRRAVMARMRERGYNAGICKVRWENGGGLMAGSYEYIDVVDEEDDRRYIVDLGFAAEFEIARGTEEYERIVQMLPAVAVAKPEEMKEAVRILAEEARKSLNSKGMSVPPWRKKRYMMAKWLGPYRRTVNPVSAEAGSSEVGGYVMCRAVGFGTQGISGVRLPAAGRSRQEESRKRTKGDKN